MKITKELIQPEPPPAQYTIVLNSQEASDLFHLMRCIGSDETYDGDINRIRALTDNLYDALKKTGLTFNGLSLKTMMILHQK